MQGPTILIERKRVHDIAHRIIIGRKHARCLQRLFIPSGLLAKVVGQAVSGDAEEPAGKGLFPGLVSVDGADQLEKDVAGEVFGQLRVSTLSVEVAIDLRAELIVECASAARSPARARSTIWFKACDSSAKLAPPVRTLRSSRVSSLAAEREASHLAPDAGFEFRCICVHRRP
jgi:hypothetical protein